MATIDRYVERSGFSRIGFRETEWGQVYVAERYTDEGWIVLWLTRDPLNIHLPDGKKRAMMRELTMSLQTDQSTRFEAAIESATEALKDQLRFIPVLARKEFDATA